jgi:hypothetical protein
MSFSIQDSAEFKRKCTNPHLDDLGNKVAASLSLFSKNNSHLSNENVFRKEGPWISQIQYNVLFFNRKDAKGR